MSSPRSRRSQLVQMPDETAHERGEQIFTAGDPPDDLRQRFCDRVVLDRDEQQYLAVADKRGLSGHAAAHHERALPVSAGVEDLREEQARLHDADRFQRIHIYLIILRDQLHPPQPLARGGIKGADDLRLHTGSSFRAIRKARHFRVEPDRGKTVIILLIFDILYDTM